MANVMVNFPLRFLLREKLNSGRILFPQSRGALRKPNTWDKIFKNGPSKICGIQPLKNVIWSPEADHIILNF